MNNSRVMPNVGIAIKIKTVNQLLIQSLLKPLTIIALSENRNKVYSGYVERCNKQELNSNFIRVIDSKQLTIRSSIYT